MRMFRRLRGGVERPIYSDLVSGTFAEVDPGEILIIHEVGWPEVTVENDRAGALLKIGGVRFRLRVDAGSRVHVLASTDEAPETT